jgi:ribosomal protein S12 methylthiotransferase accessory factor
MRELVQPIGGLIQKLEYVVHSDQFDRVLTAYAELGDTSRLAFDMNGPMPGRYCTVPPGIGSGLSTGAAAIPAIGEALERYCVYTFNPEQFIVSSASELGTSAIDHSTLPRCADWEYADPKCPIRPFDPKAPMRWVWGFDLLRGRRVLIPAVMVYLHTGFLNPSEHFWLPNTSGCAVHRSFEMAIITGICELVERDVLATMWIRQLPLPRLDLSNSDTDLASSLWATVHLQRSYLEYVLLNATSDVGLPCVCGVQIARHSKDAHTLVSCSCSASSTQAVEKVLLDMSTCRLAFNRPRPIPQKIEDFDNIFHGATYMARTEQFDAFSFLLSPDNGTSALPLTGDADPRSRLMDIMGRLERLGMNIFVVDISTDEVIRSEMRAVRVIIPELQPISFHHRARFLAHPRLRAAPINMGYINDGEALANPFPNPFA